MDYFKEYNRVKALSRKIQDNGTEINDPKENRINKMEMYFFTQLWRNGMSYKDIGQKFNCGPAYVSARVKKQYQLEGITYDPKNRKNEKKRSSTR